MTCYHVCVLKQIREPKCFISTLNLLLNSYVFFLEQCKLLFLKCVTLNRFKCGALAETIQRVGFET